MNEQREQIIRNYIAGYNSFDIEKMTLDFKDEIVFQNIQNNEVNMILNGITDFKQQAEKARLYFETREQRITAMKHDISETEFEIEYLAVWAMDLPNGLKKGQKLALTSKSIFKFQDNKIVQLIDIS